MIPCRPILAATLCLAPLAGAQESPAIPWDLQALSKAPAFQPAPEHDQGKVKAVFFDGLPWQGKSTRVFAYYAVPETTPAEPAPGMVLVHGGGGSAFQSWVNLWLDRGYAAIAIAYPLDSLRKSYQLPAAPRQLAVRIRMEHGQPQGQAPAEIHAFADAILRGKPALATIRTSGCTGGEAWAEFSAPTAIRHAELAYTTDPGEWQKREWKSIPADIKGLRVTAGLPQGTTAHYFNLTDDRGLLVSSDLITPP